MRTFDKSKLANLFDDNRQTTKTAQLAGFVSNVVNQTNLSDYNFVRENEQIVKFSFTIDTNDVQNAVKTVMGE